VRSQFSGAEIAARVAVLAVLLSAPEGEALGGTQEVVLAGSEVGGESGVEDGGEAKARGSGRSTSGVGGWLLTAESGVLCVTRMIFSRPWRVWSAWATESFPTPDQPLSQTTGAGGRKEDIASVEEATTEKRDLTQFDHRTGLSSEIQRSV